MRRCGLARRERSLYAPPSSRLARWRLRLQNDQVGERHLLAALCRAVERLLDTREGLEHLRQLGRLVGRPILLGLKTNARAVRPAALVGAAEGRGRRPGGPDQFGDGKFRSEDLGLEVGNILRVDQLVIRLRAQGLARSAPLSGPPGRDSVRADPCRVRQLEPRAGEGIREFIRMLVEAPGDLLVNRIHPQREIRDQHGRRLALRPVEGIRNCTGAGAALRLELVRAGRTLGQSHS